jgi:hypothetical protein
MPNVAPDVEERRRRAREANEALRSKQRQATADAKAGKARRALTAALNKPLDTETIAPAIAAARAEYLLLHQEARRGLFARMNVQVGALFGPGTVNRLKIRLQELAQDYDSRLTWTEITDDRSVPQLQAVARELVARFNALDTITRDQ